MMQAGARAGDVDDTIIAGSRGFLSSAFLMQALR